MKFTYMSEDDAKKAMLLPAGVYDFEVIKAEEKRSKKGNDMIALTLRVFSDDGERTVHDYLMEVMRFKLLHWAKVTGLWDKYEAGTMEAEDCLHRTGKVQLIVEESDGYAPKNSVKDYVTTKPAADGEATVIKKPAAAPVEADSSIPF